MLYQQRWRARSDASVNAATPLIIGDQVFFSASYDTGALLLKLKANGAEEVWTDEKIMSNQYNTCIYHDGQIYGFDGRQDSPIPPTLRCVRSEDQEDSLAERGFRQWLDDSRRRSAHHSHRKGGSVPGASDARGLPRDGKVSPVGCTAMPGADRTVRGTALCADQKKLVCVNLAK